MLVHAQAAVGIPVVGKAHVAFVLYDKLLQALDVRAAASAVDVQSVGLGVDDADLGSQCAEHRGRDAPGAAVGAVQRDVLAAEGEAAERNQIAHVAIASGHMVHGAADGFAGGKGRYARLAVEEVLHLLQDIVLHLLALVVQQLDAVVVEGVVARRDHDAAVEFVGFGDECHRGRGGDVEQVGVGARRGDACGQGVFQHVRRAARVLADDDACRLAVGVLGGVIVAEEAADLECVLGCQRDTGFTAEAVRTKVFSHRFLIFLR